MSNKYNFADSLSRPNIGRTAFDLTETKVFDTDVGTLNVGYYRYVNPGDKFQISQKMIVRLNPLVNPAYVRMYAVCHYFFVPFRQLWKDWENFLTRGVDGNDELIIPRLYNPKVNMLYTGSPYQKSYLTDDTSTATKTYLDSDTYYIVKGSFYENLGLPIPSSNTNSVFTEPVYKGTTTNNELIGYASSFKPAVSNGLSLEDIPHNFLYSAYLHIWNNYYMDENLQIPYAYHLVGENSTTYDTVQEIGNVTTNQNPLIRYGNMQSMPFYNMDKINGQEPILPPNPLLEGLLQANFKKDYFTSQLPFQQRGTAPAIPVTSSYTLDENGFLDTSSLTRTANFPNLDGSYTNGSSASFNTTRFDNLVAIVPLE